LIASVSELTQTIVWIAGSSSWVNAFISSTDVRFRFKGRGCLPLDRLDESCVTCLAALEEEKRPVPENKPSGLVQGTLYMLILKTLDLEPMHGYGIGVRLAQISKGVFQVNAVRFSRPCAGWSVMG
jgi:hypothetical protein